MATAPAISLDRFRRRSREAVTDALAVEQQPHPLVGSFLGLIERRFGLMSSETPVRIADVVSTSGDLAVADRMAFVAAMQQHVTVLVVACDGWYVACTIDGSFDVAELATLRPQTDSAAPRIMSIVSQRGITPALGPLACA